MRVFDYKSIASLIIQQSLRLFSLKNALEEKMRFYEKMVLENTSSLSLIGENRKEKS